MKTYMVGILDKDPDYAGAFMDYVNYKRELGLRLVLFSGIKAVEDYLAAGNLDLIITDDLHDLKEKDSGYDLMGVKAAVWSEYDSRGDVWNSAENSAVNIYKYQKAETICKQIRNILYEEKPDARKISSCIGVYSPIGRCGKTTLAKALALNDEVRGGLYISMEDFGTDVNGLSNEILYMIKTKSPRLEEALVQRIVEEGGISVLRLSGTFIDTHDVTVSDMETLRTSLLQLGRYTTVVFDIGSASICDMSILSMFDRLYVPVLRDEVSVKKFEVFTRMLKDMDMRSVITKLITVDIPNVSYDSNEMVRTLWEIKKGEVDRDR